MSDASTGTSVLSHTPQTKAVFKTVGSVLIVLFLAAAIAAAVFLAMNYLQDTSNMTDVEKVDAEESKVPGWTVFGVSLLLAIVGGIFLAAGSVGSVGAGERPISETID
jgi:formate/nitrite transporter FocA (FNT family)